MGLPATIASSCSLLSTPTSSGAPRTARAHRYQGRGGSVLGSKSCLGVGGVRIDRAVTQRLLEAVAPHAVEAALEAAERARQLNEDICGAIAASANSFSL
jgi:hypothetical protein